MRDKWKCCVSILALSAVTLFCMINPIQKGSAEYLYYPEKTIVAASDTVLRNGPNMGAEVLSPLPAGTKIDMISDFKAGPLEYYILGRVNGVLGYIPTGDTKSESYLSTCKITAESLDTPFYMEVTGNIYENSYNELVKYYMMVPETIRKNFESDGFRIIMREQDITQEAYAEYGGYTGIGTVEAVSDYEKKVIYVQDEYPRQIIHEMGHYVNNKWGFSKQSGFKELASSEAAKISIYAGNSVSQTPNEYFSEVFDLYIRDPQALQIISPASFEMMAQVMASFK